MQSKPTYYRSRSHNVKLLSFVLTLTVPIAFGCSKSAEAPVEAPPTSQIASSPEPPQLTKLPPKLIEVQDAVKRVFKDSATIDTNHDPTFIAGDFNGDSSQDIAIILKPAPGKIADLNEEYPAWMLRDVASTSEVPSTPLQVEENESLLAVIHGYGTADWRDPEATQTYLLKHAVGRQMQSLSAKDFLETNQGKNLPRIHGDLISAVLRGSSGYLYYSGATYTWYDPKTFKGEPPRRLVHPQRVNY
jgi:hypothetical protein